jgi:polysaccharide biosynthesis protein PslJ
VRFVDRLRAGDPIAARRAVSAGAVVVVLIGSAIAAFVHPLVGVAAVVAVGVAPLVLRDIDLAFLAVVGVITLLPFAALPLGIGFNPTLLDLALGVLYLIWIVRLATREQVSLRLPPLSAPVIAFAGLMLVAFLAGTAHGMPAKNTVRTFGELVLGAGLFVVVGNLVTDRPSLRRVFRALVGLGTIAAGVGLALYLLPDAWQVRLLSTLHVVDYPAGLGVLRFINDDPSRLQRATGTAIDPNSFGGLLAVVAALLAPQVISRAPLVARRTALVMLAVVCAALLATVSRGSLLGFGVAMGVIGLARDRRVLVAVAVAGVALLLLAQVLPWTSAYVAHFTQGLRIEDRATQMRAGEYKDAFRLIARYPVFGVGFGSPRDVDLYRGVSSLYLIIAETMGLVGLGAFLVASGALGARLTLAWRRMAHDDLRAVVLGCLAALAAALTSGVFDHYFFTYPHAFALLWLVAGLGMSAVALSEA